MKKFLALAMALVSLNAFASDAPSKNGTKQEKSEKQAELLTPFERATKLRDPFKRPNLSSSDRSKTDLELYPTEKFRVVGVTTGPAKTRAMVIAPNGRTYFVAENMKMGNRKGIVKQITPKFLIVREKVVNIFGQEETVNTELKLPSESSEQSLVSPSGW
jgi:Tfp pilus assembly protein PilP